MASKSTKPEPGHGPAIGTINVLEATIGQRGMGKSTYQCWRARELVAQHGGQAYVIGHSLGARLPMSLPASLGGGDLPIEYHRTITELDSALHARPTRWHILAPPLSLDGGSDPISSCDDLIAYSIRLSESLRKRAFARAHALDAIVAKSSAHKYDGLPSPFVVVIVDEGIAMEAAAMRKDVAGQKKKDWFLQWLYSLRHYHTALLYAIQNATARNWQLLSEATRVVVFRVRHQWALNAVQAAGGTQKEIRAVKKLGPHEYVALGEDPRLADDDEDDLDGWEPGESDDASDGAGPNGATGT